MYHTSNCSATFQTTIIVYSYNADDTVVKPIDWGSILHADPLPQSPQEVRAYVLELDLKGTKKNSIMASVRT